MCLVVICLATAGCREGSLAAVSTSKETSTSAGNVSTPGGSGRIIDAGIVLADRAGYFCLTLEQVGLPPDAEIVSLESSCSCVQPRLVQYFADRQRMSQVILLEYVSELPSSVTISEARVIDVQPVHLSVIIEVGFVDGKKQDFTVNLLHTFLHQDEYETSASKDRSFDRQVSSILSVGE